MSQKLFRTVALAALIVGIGKFFRFRAWKMAGGPQGKHWYKPHGPMSHRPMPPWFRHWEKPFEKAEKAGPDAETGAAEAVV
jgi:hypothetical protein